MKGVKSTAIFQKLTENFRNISDARHNSHLLDLQFKPYKRQKSEDRGDAQIFPFLASKMQQLNYECDVIELQSPLFRDYERSDSALSRVICFRLEKQKPLRSTYPVTSRIMDKIN